MDTPRMKQILAQPVGTPVELTREEALAILQHHLDNPKSYDAEKHERDLKRLRKIRRMWGTVADLDA